MHTARINRGRLAGRLITYQLNRKEATTGKTAKTAAAHAEEQVRSSPTRASSSGI
jgi:hypothetical protein